MWQPFYEQVITKRVRFLRFLLLMSKRPLVWNFYHFSCKACPRKKLVCVYFRRNIQEHFLKTGDQEYRLDRFDRVWFLTSPIIVLQCAASTWLACGVFVFWGVFEKGVNLSTPEPGHTTFSRAEALGKAAEDIQQCWRSPETFAGVTSASCTLQVIEDLLLDFYMTQVFYWLRTSKPMLFLNDFYEKSCQKRLLHGNHSEHVRMTTIQKNKNAPFHKSAAKIKAQF